MASRTTCLVLVIATLVGAGCGGKGSGSSSSTAARASTAAATFTLAAPSGSTPSTLTRSAAILRTRLSGLSDTKASVVLRGGRIVVDARGRGPNDALLRSLLTTPGRLAVYDWEANVLGSDGRPHPADPAVTGGQAAGDEGASGCVTRARARTISRRAGGVTVVVRAAAPERNAVSNPCFYVLRARPSLGGADVRTSGAGSDTQTKQPIVELGFTRQGASRFRELTRTVARRGASLKGSVAAPDRNQHIAIALDGRLLTTVFIDYRENPDGIRTTGTEISGSFTQKSARELAAPIGAGALPVDLRLVSAAP